MRPVKVPDNFEEVLVLKPELKEFAELLPKQIGGPRTARKYIEKALYLGFVTGMVEGARQVVEPIKAANE